MTHPLPFASSASEFIARLDQIKDISPEHPIFLEEHPDDYPFDPSQAPKMTRCCFTNTPPPLIHANSHKAKIRELAAKHDAQLKSLPRKLHALSWPFISALIPAFSRLMLQLTRPFMTIFWGYCVVSTLMQLYLQSELNPSSSNLTVSLAIYSGLFSFWVYTVCHDEMLMREFGWHSKVKHGHYTNPNDPLLSKFFTKDHHNPYFNGSIEYANIKSPLLFDGDWRTAVPFGLFAPDEIPYTRRWVQNHVDNESIAFDISFPIRTRAEADFAQAQQALDNIPLKPGQLYSGPLETARRIESIFEYYHDPTKVVHVVLFGLNGGSNEPYILDYVEKMNQMGHTCVVFITRSLMGTLVCNGGSFDAAKTLDLENCIRSVHIACGNGVHDDLMTAPKGTYSVATVFKHNVMSRTQSLQNKWWKTPISLSGWSLGGVMTTLYCVVHGEHSGILCAAGLATSGDARINMGYENSKKNWQGFLAFAAKVNIIIPQQHLLAPSGGAKYPIDFDAVEGIDMIADLDDHFTCKYHGYANAEEYYHKLSFALKERMENNQTPLLVLHADDDPVISVDTLLPSIEWIQSGQSKNLIVSITRGGGHCGWAVGLNPFAEKWTYPVNMTRNFANEIASSVWQN